jgi:predicted patatin/cPLA2 family phospholipase
MTAQRTPDSEESFVLPEGTYRSPLEEGYQPAWKGATLLDCSLVLEGGAMRGQFTAGVLDYLMDEGALPRRTVGVSAGALNGFNYRAGIRGRSILLNTKYCTNWRYFSMRSYALTGSAFNSKFVFERIPQKLEPFDYDGYAASPLELVTVASDLVSGEADYFNLKDARTEIDYLRASSSMPLLSKIVETDNKKLLDGGICDSVPLDYAISWGGRKHIVVLTQHDGYIKPDYKLMPLVRRVYKDYPYFIERFEHRSYEYNRSYRKVKRMKDAGEIFALMPPSPVQVESMEHDPRKLYHLYLVGYEQARRNWKAIQMYLDA